MKQQNILIAYDIQSDNARSRALYHLRKCALSYQDSVFELQLSATTRQRLIRKLQPYISTNDTLLSVHFTPNACWQLGCGLPSLSGLFLVIG